MGKNKTEVKRFSQADIDAQFAQTVDTLLKRRESVRTGQERLRETDMKLAAAREAVESPRYGSLAALSLTVLFAILGWVSIGDRVLGNGPTLVWFAFAVLCLGAFIAWGAVWLGKAYDVRTLNDVRLSVLDNNNWSGTLLANAVDSLDEVMEMQITFDQTVKAAKENAKTVKAATKEEKTP